MMTNYTSNQQNSVAFCLHFLLKYRNLNFFLPFFETLSDSIVFFEVEETDSIESKPNDLWQIDVYLEFKPVLEMIQIQLDEIAKQNSIEKSILKVTELEQLDWVSEVQKSFKPISAGKFFIFPSTYQEILDDNLINIEINAGSAFGTGEHETTSNCLVALSKWCKGFKALDMGCGSGILAIAMAKFGVKSVVALDIDPQAVSVAKYNDQVNSSNISVIEISDGYNSSFVKDNEPFDIICSNILAAPLIEMAQSASRALKSGGVIILAGFLTNQQGQVLKAYQDCGFELLEIIEQNNWPAVVLKRK